MPFDNNGQFIRIHNWTEDKSNNIPITASRMDAEDDGFATGLSQTFLRDGSVALTGDLKAGNNKLTGLKNGTENTDAATVGQLNTVQGNAVLLTGDQTVAGVKTFTSSPVVPTPSADDSSTKVATTKWVNTTGNNVVHKTDTETITGLKTFATPYGPNLKIVGDIDTTITELDRLQERDNEIILDKYGNNALSIYETQDEDGKYGIGIQAGFIHTNNSKNYYDNSIFINSEGNTYAPTPTDTSSELSNEIATVGWVNTTGNNVVHKTDNEIINGTKTFAGDGWITYIKNTEVTYNTAPATDVITGVMFTDKNNTQMGVVECFRHTDNSTVMHFNVYGANGAWASHDLQLKVAADGTAAAHAPNPPSASNDTNIATTKWVKDQGYIANSSGKITIYSQDGTKFNGFQIAENDNYAFKVLNPNQGANGWWSVTAMTSQSLAKNGYICFNHGLIINWGQYDYADGTDYNVTFSKAFTSTNYQMTFGHELNESTPCDYYGPQIRKGTKTTTGCTVYNRNNANARTSWVTWIAIGY